ncbi:Protein-tyrosine phosphatase [Cooperia oncophora]
MERSKLGKVPKFRRRPSNTITMTTVEEDGTQVERKAKRRSRRPTARPHAVDQTVFKEAFKMFCDRTLKMGVNALTDEFMKLKMATQSIGNRPKTAWEANQDKNRYREVFCVDTTRVILTWPAGMNDYINANWVSSVEKPKKFICTQGPMDKTIDDFWRMIWQEKCRSIVMLCNLTECGKQKCEQYWPLSAETPQEHSLEHFHWKDWPDRGVPASTTLSIFRLLTQVSTILAKHLWRRKSSPNNDLFVNTERACRRKALKWQVKEATARSSIHASQIPDKLVATLLHIYEPFKEHSLATSLCHPVPEVNRLTPCVVHCSAGIGRTGTVVGIDLLYRRLEKGEKDATLLKVVSELREMRHGAVQMDAQYLYMHRILLVVAENLKIITPEETQKFNDDYDQMLKSRGFT